MPAPNPIRVLVAATDALTRSGLAALVSEVQDCVLAGQVADDARLSGEIEVFGPDVVLWDAAESQDGVAAAAGLTVPVIAIVRDEQAGALAWKNGARGILPRNVRPDTLAAAFRAVAQGLAVVDAELADVLSAPAMPAPSEPAENLTGRELEVLRLVAEGLSNKSIASHLGISEHTAKFHVNSILGKMGAQSRTQAVTLATRLGLITL